MIHALLAGAEIGAWFVGLVTVVFVGMTILAGAVKLGRSLSAEKGPE